MSAAPAVPFEWHSGQPVFREGLRDERCCFRHRATTGAKAQCSATPAVDWTTSHTWSFNPIDNEKFPAIDLARRCGTLGGGLPAIFNAANEVAVSAFIEGKIAFTDIARLIEETLAQSKTREPSSLSDVLQADAEARALTTQLIQRLAR